MWIGWHAGRIHGRLRDEGMMRTLGRIVLIAMAVVGLWCLLALTCMSQLHAADSFGYFHYAGPNESCNCDSLIGNRHTSTGQCTNDPVLYWLADRASIVVCGAGSPPNGHVPAILDRKSSMLTFSYETITDEQYGTGTAWKSWVSNHAGNPTNTGQYEKSF